MALEQEATLVRSTPQALVGLAEQALGMGAIFWPTNAAEPEKAKVATTCSEIAAKMGRQTEADQQMQGFGAVGARSAGGTSKARFKRSV